MLISLGLVSMANRHKGCAKYRVKTLGGLMLAPLALKPAVI